MIIQLPYAYLSTGSRRFLSKIFNKNIPLWVGIKNFQHLGFLDSGDGTILAQSVLKENASAAYDFQHFGCLQFPLLSRLLWNEG